MAFPTLFPDGKGDPTSNDTVRDIARSSTESFAHKFKHLIMFAERVKGTWVYRFASHPRFAYWAYNILYRKRLLSQGNIFIRQNPQEAALENQDFIAMLNNNDYSSFMSKLMHYAKNVTGTNAYWNKAKNNLKAIIMQEGPPTVFWTLSCAEFHWPEFHSLFSDHGEVKTLRDNVIQNPHVLIWLFTKRTESFVKWWLYKTLKATWHWYRYEFAVQRGSIHCHGVAKLDDDPGLCNLTKIALCGHLSQKKIESAATENPPHDENLNELQQNVLDGKQAEQIICEYVDKLLSTWNPEPPDELNWKKPPVHPCAKKFCEISEQSWDTDYVDLLNTVQRHSICNSAYCLKEKDGNQYCRFKYPFDKCDKTNLQFEKIHTKDGSVKYKATVVTARNDTRLNRHQRLQLQSWRANCDINIVIDYHSCIEYLAKYASKAERISTVAKSAFLLVMGNMHPSGTHSALKKLMIKAVGERDMSIQEVMHHILSLKMLSSTFQVISLSLDGSRKVEVDDEGLITTKKSLLDNYAMRNQFQEKHPNVMQLNLIQSLSQYEVKNDTSCEYRKKKIVLKTYPNYSNLPSNPNYGLFCKYQLLKYKPWSQTLSHAWNYEPETDDVFISYWDEFLHSQDAETFVPNWESELQNVSTYYLSNDDTQDEGQQLQTGDYEDWMLLSNLHSSYMANNDGEDENAQTGIEYWSTNTTHYSPEQIGDMPQWIQMQKEIYIDTLHDSSIPVDVSTLNADQHKAYTLIFNHFHSESEEQLLLIITGMAGSGKSYLISAIKDLLGNKCKIAAFFGVAAFNVKGQTLHSLLQLPIRGKRAYELNGDALQRLQAAFENIAYLLIDEFSVIGQSMLGWISKRLKQATGKTQLPFGGISVILIGDIAQLPPVSDKVLYHDNPSNEVSTEGFYVYNLFNCVVLLSINQRVAGINQQQSQFRDLLLNLRNGTVTIEQWKLLLQRTPQSVNNLSEFSDKAIKLAFTNEKVATHNYNSIQSLKEPIALVKAKHNNCTASKLSADDMGGLQPKPLICKGARVMLIRNLWTEIGLCNGSMGTVIDIIYKEGQCPPSLPICVIFKFDTGYSGPSFIAETPNTVPIPPVVSVSDSMGSTYERQQLPLKLAWAITIHKSQGLTLDRAWVDLGETEATAGLTYVAISRVRTLQHLVIEQMTLERLKAVRNCLGYRYRVREENRLASLAQCTHVTTIHQ